jgi:hypothetical protein
MEADLSTLFNGVIGFGCVFVRNTQYGKYRAVKRRIALCMY